MTKKIKSPADFGREFEKLKRQNLSTFGARLHKVRKDRGLTQTQFAMLAGISRSYYSELELDQKRPPLSFLQFLGREGVDLNWLIFGDLLRGSHE